MKAVSVMPWVAVGVLVMSAVSYVSFLFTGAKWAALVGVGGFLLAILLMVCWVVAVVGVGGRK